mmetsp:Transcript_31383/g.47442  ORF Transcript_31383/g.47442 Transcript_31383/m.47442 type:complete len:121 (+) Transcript_31383:460-822(+)
MHCKESATVIHHSCTKSALLYAKFASSDCLFDRYLDPTRNDYKINYLGFRFIFCLPFSFSEITCLFCSLAYAKELRKSLDFHVVFMMGVQGKRKFSVLLGMYHMSRTDAKRPIKIDTAIQ